MTGREDQGLSTFERASGAELGEFLPSGGKLVRLEDGKGLDVFTLYRPYTGIELYFCDIRREPREEEYTTYPDMIEMNYCMEGRFECDFGPNSGCFMAPGDLSACSMMKRKT